MRSPATAISDFCILSEIALMDSPSRYFMRMASCWVEGNCSMHAASSAADSLRIIRWLGEDESEGIICSNWSGSDEEFPVGWIVTSSLAERFWVAKCSWWAVATLLRRMCRYQARKDSIVSPRKAPKSRDASR